jgi:hypothetical protein
MAKGKEFKKAKSKESKRFKEPDSPPPNYSTYRPIFSFYHMKYGGSYCLSKCRPRDKSDLAHTLVKLSQQTWNEITSTHRKTLGYEKIPLEQFHITSFPSIISPDVRSLIVFSCSHACRMAGIIERDVYHIILVGDDLYDH